jgi:hypothetical protein
LDLARLVLGLLVAALLPSSLEFFRRRPLAAWAFIVLYSAYAAFPALPGWKGLAVWIMAATAGLARTSGAIWKETWRNLTGQKNLRRPSTWFSDSTRRRIVILAALLALTVGVYYGTRSLTVAASLWREDSFSVILSGFLLAVFAGNLVVVRIVRPYFDGLSPEQRNGGLLHLGTRLGWIERALVFVFIAAGQPEAAALAITVKSLVRVQGNDDPRFGQYVIVGAMSSLLVAVGAGIVVRIALGLPAL